MIVAITQIETPGVLPGRGAQLTEVLDPVHRQGRRVGPGNGLVDLDQHHPVGQPGNDLQQLTTVGIGGRDLLIHWVSMWSEAHGDYDHPQRRHVPHV
ncbi:hypothetical protein D3C78_1411720 [compost metagenome]